MDKPIDLAAATGAIAFNELPPCWKTLSSLPISLALTKSTLAHRPQSRDTLDPSSGVVAAVDSGLTDSLDMLLSEADSCW